MAHPRSGTNNNNPSAAAAAAAGETAAKAATIFPPVGFRRTQLVKTTVDANGKTTRSMFMPKGEGGEPLFNDTSTRHRPLQGPCC